MVGYCKRCGDVGAVFFRRKCKSCGIKLNSLSKDMQQKYNLFTDEWSSTIFGLRELDTEEEKRRRIDELLSRKNNFIMNEVANNPLFSKEEYEKQVQNDREGFYRIAQYSEPRINKGNFIAGPYYCKKCGRVVLRVPTLSGDMDDTCDYCKSKVYLVPKKYWHNGSSSLLTKEQQELLREELVKTAPEFDEYLFNHRDSDLQQRWSELNAALEHGKAILEGRDKGNKFGIECPYCHATNVKKITNTSKAIHTAAFGVFSVARNSKEWHCNHCNSDF